MVRLTPRTAASSFLVLAAACGGAAQVPLVATVGPQPSLVRPAPALIPIVRVAEAVGWQDDELPTPAAGLRVSAFARGLDHPRWIHVLPNGDVLVAESAAPESEVKPKGIKGWAFSRLMKHAGAAVRSADRITLLRDADHDGVAETRTVFLEGLHSPFGMALVGDVLYVANADALVRVPYAPGDLRSPGPPEVVTTLPGEPRNHHWTKNVIASPDGTKLYVAVGSNSNVGEHGMEAEVERAAILEVDPRDGARRIFASGMRNPVGMTWVQPDRAAPPALWTSVNERDEIGSDLVPDYMTSVREGGFYGWPYSYYGAHVDPRVQPTRPDLVAAAIVPDYALGAHTASMGLAYSPAAALAPQFGEGMFVGQHGSWNRYPPSGYRVVFVPFRDGRPSGAPLDVLTGFLHDGKARGRPVGVALDGRGGLLVADDVGNAVWRVR